jgi:hypothetical protein
MSKKLLAVAVALCVAVPSTFAGWDYFSVIEENKGEAKFGYYDGGYALKIRYSPLENLEILSAAAEEGAVAGVSSNYAIGARYQIVPLLAGFLDFGIPTALDEGNRPFGLTPGINVMTDFTDNISFGSQASLGIDFADTTKLTLNIGIELDFTLTEQILLWAGFGLELPDMTADPAPDAVIPLELGFSFSVGNLSLGTLVGLKLDHKDREGKDATGGYGGVEFGIKF